MILTIETNVIVDFRAIALVTPVENAKVVCVEHHLMARRVCHVIAEVVNLSERFLREHSNHTLHSLFMSRLAHSFAISPLAGKKEKSSRMPNYIK